MNEQLELNFDQPAAETESRKENKLWEKPIQTVDELFDFSKSTYKTHTPEVYRKGLEEMNLIDLQKECWRVQLMPNDNRNIMKERLMKEFMKRVGFVTKVIPKPIKFKVNQQMSDILSEGKNKLII